MNRRAALARLSVLMATAFVEMVGFLVVLPLLPFYATRLGGDAIAVRSNSSVVQVTFNGAPTGYNAHEFSTLPIRLHGGDDLLDATGLSMPRGLSVFGGAGNDRLAGGAGNSGLLAAASTSSSARRIQVFTVLTGTPRRLASCSRLSPWM